MTLQAPRRPPAGGAPVAPTSRAAIGQGLTNAKAQFEIAEEERRAKALVRNIVIGVHLVLLAVGAVVAVWLLNSDDDDLSELGSDLRERVAARDDGGDPEAPHPRDAPALTAAERTAAEARDAELEGGSPDAAGLGEGESGPPSPPGPDPGPAPRPAALTGPLVPPTPPASPPTRDIFRDAAIDFSQDFTVTVSFQSEGPGILMSWVAPGGGWTDGGRLLYFNEEHLVWDVHNLLTLKGICQPADGRPHRVALITEGTRVDVWLDGQLVAHFPQAQRDQPPGFVLKIGRGPPSKAPHLDQGQVWGLSYWPEALTGAHRDALLRGDLAALPDAAFTWGADGPVPAPAPGTPDPPAPPPSGGPAYASAAEALIEFRFPDALAALADNPDPGVATARGALETAANINGVVLGTFQGQAGETITIGTVAQGDVHAEVGEVVDGRIHATQLIQREVGTGRVQIELGLGDLSAEEFARRAATAGEGPLALYHGMRALRAKDPSRAISYFEHAPDGLGPALIAALEARDAAAATSARNAEAEAAWAAVAEAGEAIDDAATAQGFLAALARFREGFSDSEFARARADQIASWEARAAEVSLPDFPYMTSFENAEVGGFESIVTEAGTWTVIQGAAEIDAGRASTGRRSLHFGGGAGGGSDIIELRFPERLPGGQIKLSFRAERLSADGPFEFRVLDAQGNEMLNADDKIQPGPGLRTALSIGMTGGRGRIRFRCAAPEGEGMIIDDLRVESD